MPCDDECKSKQVKSFSHDPDPNVFVRVCLRLEVSGSAFFSCHFHPNSPKGLVFLDQIETWCLVLFLSKKCKWSIIIFFKINSGSLLIHIQVSIISNVIISFSSWITLIHEFSQTWKENNLAFENPFLISHKQAIL